MCYENSREWFELPPKKVEDLIKIMTNENSDLPLDNIVYYPPRTRVLWRGEPGVVFDLHIKSYEYEVGYDIRLDSQKSKEEPRIYNSGYHELVLEDTGKKSTDGYRVEPREPM
jgi:hypothetical protein